MNPFLDVLHVLWHTPILNLPVGEPLPLIIHGGWTPALGEWFWGDGA